MLFAKLAVSQNSSVFWCNDSTEIDSKNDEHSETGNNDWRLVIGPTLSGAHIYRSNIRDHRIIDFSRAFLSSFQPHELTSTPGDSNALATVGQRLPGQIDDRWPFLGIPIP